MYIHSIFIHSSVDRHLDWFLFLVTVAAVNSTAVNIDVHMSLRFSDVDLWEYAWSCIN